MTVLRSFIAISIALMVSPSLFAQGQIAQVVQLPTFSQFTVGTTVVVPDSGAGFLGGVKRARYGSTTAGVPGASKVPYLSRLFKNRGIGHELSSRSAFAHARIIDHAELDEAVLSEAAALRLGYREPSAADRKAAFLSRHVSRRAAGANEPPRVFSDGEESVADIRKRREAAERKKEAELAVYVQRARRAEAAGKWSSARLAYQAISRRASGKLKQHALDRVTAILAREEAVSLAGDSE